MLDGKIAQPDAPDGFHDRDHGWAVAAEKAVLIAMRLAGPERLTARSHLRRQRKG